MLHSELQRIAYDIGFADGPRAHVDSKDEIVQYISRWRVDEALRRIDAATGGRVARDSRVLVLCGGEAHEGTMLCDAGFQRVTVSDISPVAVAAAVGRDSRYEGKVLDAERVALPGEAYDLVVVQDGLHHLQSPIGGFTEMLRLARVAALFFEPHDSLVGNTLGTKWERHGDAVNHVFRWTRGLVGQIASSYLGPDSFDNLSFSFFHHNVVYDRIATLLGRGALARRSVETIKWSLDHALPGMGNQFCGLVRKRHRLQSI
jgi:hypothetical protein